MAVDYSHCQTRKNPPNQERLRELFDYPPGAKHLTWKVDRGSAKAGSIAGTLSIKGYRQVMVDGVLYLETRLIWCWMTGEYPPDQINHINTDRDDNCWENLELSTNPENHRNKTRYANNTSGVTGVYWNKAKGKWMARVMIDGKQRSLGYFENLEAAKAKLQAYYKANGFSPTHGMTQDEVIAYHASQDTRPADAQIVVPV